MKNALSRIEAKKEIEKSFKNIKNKTPKEIKKIKRFAMSYNIPLKENRKLFCKKCYAPYKNSKVRIKNKMKSVICESCGNVGRWKL